MLNFHNLLQELKGQHEVVEAHLDDNFNFALNDYAYLIESGSMLVTGEKNAKSGFFPTHTLEKHDPVGFAEAILARSIGLQYRQKSNLILYKFRNVDLRDLVARANIFSKTIITYSIGRILGQSRDSSTLAFEEEFIEKNYKLLRRRVVSKNEEITQLGAVATEMFFIEKGSVQILSGEKNPIAALS